MKITFKVKCPICNREAQGTVMTPVHPGPEHAFICPYWREDPEEYSDPLDDVVTEAPKTEGFGVSTDIDVQATTKKKRGEDILPYRILGACNPSLAHRAFTAEPSIGLLVPCNVVMRQEVNGTVHVEFMNPATILNLVDNLAIPSLATEVRDRLDRVLAAL